MKKISYLIALLALSINAKAQKTVIFKYKYLPNYTYASNMKTDMDMEMNMKMDSATAAAAANQNILMKMNMAITADIKTGAENADKNMPFSITYNNMNVVATMNGKEMPMPSSGIEGKVLTGTCDADSKMHIDTVNNTGDPKVNAAMKDAFNKIQAAIKFPDKPLAIGESFIQDLPMQFPAGDFKMDLSAKTTYTLTSIKDGMAYFDTKVVMNMDMDAKQMDKSMNMAGGGGGAGKMVFDIKKNFPVSIDSDMDINFNMDMKQFKMIMKIKGRSTMTYVVSPTK
jgi:hypothetical protein